MNTFITGLALLCLSISASAQTMYRCGNTFSQQPCSAGAKEVPTSGVPQPIVATVASPDQVEKMKVACRSWITNVPSWKDRSSIQIGEIKRLDPERRDVAGRSQLVVPYMALVNAKNSMGGYTGERPYGCYTNGDETKIIDWYQPG